MLWPKEQDWLLVLEEKLNVYPKERTSDHYGDSIMLYMRIIETCMFACPLMGKISSMTTISNLTC